MDLTVERFSLAGELRLDGRSRSTWGGVLTRRKNVRAHKEIKERFQCNRDVREP